MIIYGKITIVTNKQLYYIGKATGNRKQRKLLYQLGDCK